jgi:hypothetical protein
MRRAVVLLLVASCGHGASSPPASNNAPATFTPTVRDVDWFAFSHQADDGTSWEVREVIYGDVTGDGAEEALVNAAFNGGGSGELDEIDVYQMQNGVPVLIGKIGGGDRADGGIDAYELQGAVIRVSRNVMGPDDALCCASAQTIEWWQWDGGGFVAKQPSR